jgi:hypothetical protein
MRVVAVDRSDRQDRRRQGKSDPLDAVSGAGSPSPARPVARASSSMRPESQNVVAVMSTVITSGDRQMAVS